MEIKLNLASKLYLDSQRIRFWLLLTCAFLVLLLGLNCFYGYQNYRQFSLLESRFLELEEQASDVQTVPIGYTPESYAAVKNEIALANGIASADQFHWTALLGRLEELLPADVSIRSIQPDFTLHSVQLGCVARDLSAMTQFVDNLLTSRDLNQAYLQRHGEVESGQSVSGKIQVDFALVIREAF